MVERDETSSKNMARLPRQNLPHVQEDPLHACLVGRPQTYEVQETFAFWSMTAADLLGTLKTSGATFSPMVYDSSQWPVALQIM